MGRVVRGHHGLAPGQRIEVTLLGADSVHGFIDFEHAAGVEPRKQLRQERKRQAARELMRRVGDVFDAVVTGAGSKATYVRVLQPEAEGRLVRGRKGLRVGDGVRVMLLAADPRRGFIDFAAGRLSGRNGRVDPSAGCWAPSTWPSDAAHVYAGMLALLAAGWSPASRFRSGRPRPPGALGPVGEVDQCPAGDGDAVGASRLRSRSSFVKAPPAAGRGGFAAGAAHVHGLTGSRAGLPGRGRCAAEARPGPPRPPRLWARR